eukprot:4105101-Pleurochrysis_carterae.AAC.1
MRASVRVRVCVRMYACECTRVNVRVVCVRVWGQVGEISASPDVGDVVLRQSRQRASVQFSLCEGECESECESEFASKSASTSLSMSVI